MQTIWKTLVVNGLLRSQLRKTSNVRKRRNNAQREVGLSQVFIGSFKRIVWMIDSSVVAVGLLGWRRIDNGYYLFC
jgi:hypothetical protein